MAFGRAGTLLMELLYHENDLGRRNKAEMEHRGIEALRNVDQKLAESALAELKLLGVHLE